MKLEPYQLRGLLDTLITSLPEQARSRILIDRQGGLAYILFDSEFKVPGNSKGLTSRKRNAIGLYHLAVNDYEAEAGQLANEYGFGLICIGKGMGIFSDFNQCDDSTYKAGVGKVPITSKEELDRFCEMIKTGYERLDKRYKKVCGFAENLLPLR